MVLLYTCFVSGVHGAMRHMVQLDCAVCMHAVSSYGTAVLTFGVHCCLISGVHGGIWHSIGGGGVRGPVSTSFTNTSCRISFPPYHSLLLCCRCVWRRAWGISSAHACTVVHYFALLSSPLQVCMDACGIAPEVVPPVSTVLNQPVMLHISVPHHSFLCVRCAWRRTAQTCGCGCRIVVAAVPIYVVVFCSSVCRCAWKPTA
jgi:hypothetical protein